MLVTAQSPGTNSVRAPLPNAIETLSSSGRIPELDGLRGIAILMVLIWHYTNGFEIWAKGSFILGCLDKLRCLTWTGVDLFFVLSGFLIGGILLDHRPSPNYFKTFWARRICRIFPLYFAVLTVFILAYVSGFATRSPSQSWLFDRPLPFWSYCSFTQNITSVLLNIPGVGAFALNATWSLAVEEQFYLLLPFVIRFVPREKLFGILIALVLGAVSFRLALLLHYANVAAAFLWMPSRADSLLLGVIAAYVLRSEIFKTLLPKCLFEMKCLALALSAGMILLAEMKPASALSVSLGLTWIALLYVMVLMISISDPKSWLAHICRNRLLGKLGSISFGVYLLHQFVNGLTHSAILNSSPSISDIPHIQVTLLSAIVTLGLAYASFHLFEKRIIRFGRTFQF